MSEIKKQVEFLLKNYTAMQNEVKVLEYELRHMTYNLRSEAIEGAVLSHSGLERVSGSYHSDKTSDIVVEHVARQQNARYHTITALLHNIRSELQRMDYYLTLLPENEATVLRRFYFDNMTWAEIAEQAEAVQRTMERHKKRGIEKLVYYYSVLDRIDHEQADAKIRIHFIGLIHEERFTYYLELAGKNISRGIEAMLYILSGCNELWQADAETFFDFSAGTTKNYDESKNPLSDNGAMLLRLAYHFANGFDKDNFIYIFRHYLFDLEFSYLELAMEALKLALFPGNI